MKINDGYFRGLNVNCGNENQFEVRDDILEAILGRFRFMTECHPRVMLLRFDLRFPQSYYFSTDDKKIQKFMNSFSTYLRRRGVSYQYVWVKEINRSDNEHYHCVFFVDASKISSSYTYTCEAQNIWSRICSDSSGNASRNLVHICSLKNDYGLFLDSVLLDKNEPNFDELFSKYFYWISYLAKTNTKINNPGRGRRFWSASSCRI